MPELARCRNNRQLQHPCLNNSHSLSNATRLPLSDRLGLAVGGHARLGLIYGRLPCAVAWNVTAAASWMLHWWRKVGYCEDCCGQPCTPALLDTAQGCPRCAALELPTYGSFSAVITIQNTWLAQLFSGTPIMFPLRNAWLGAFDIPSPPSTNCTCKFSRRRNPGQRAGNWAGSNDRVVYSPQDMLPASERWWTRLRERAYIRSTHAPRLATTSCAPDNQSMALLRLGVLRSVMHRALLRPSDELWSSAAALLEGFDPARHLPMLAIHVRRTDKLADFTGAQGLHVVDPKLRRYLSYLLKLGPSPSGLEGIAQLIRHLDHYVSDRPFQSYFLLSDDEVYLEARLSRTFASFFSSPCIRRFVAAPPVLCNTSSIKPGAPPTSSVRVACEAARRRSPLSVLASVVAASEHSSYLVGMGTSAVSQTIAQRIAGRVGISPHMLALWEDFDARATTPGWEAAWRAHAS